MVNLAILFELQNIYDDEAKIKINCSESQNSLDILSKQFQLITAEKSTIADRMHLLKIKISDENFKLQTEESNIKKYTNELYTTHQSNPKYLRELETKIKELTNLRDKEEETIIQLMDDMDLLTKKQKLIEQQEQDIKEAYEIKIKSHETLKKMSSEDLLEISSKKESLRNQLEEDVLSVFDKTFKHCQGKAVATLEDDKCSICRFVIPSSLTELIKKNRDEIHFCSNCKRILIKI